jgi:mono/diheme cytochrome c family protein
MGAQRSRTRRLAHAVLLSLAANGCSSPAKQTDVERGRDLFETPAPGAMDVFAFSCSTCHDASPVAAAAATPRKPGAPLAGVTGRPTFWGGQENDLLESINDCSRLFMGQTKPLASGDADASALYAYLLSLGPGDTNAFSFTVVGTISDVPRGNADSGQALFTQFCAQCHGAMHDGSGRLSVGIPTLPEETLSEHAEFDVHTQRMIFIEKIRHGLFDGYGGAMPPFSSELMSDSQVSDVLEALGVLGQ